ncbi:MAG TPA: protein kinase [Thermoanaerobaculia bacterium]|nr:protein kinase [Thermoanaerobaculia bacterium]
MQLVAGFHVGSYQIVAPLGVGGMGEVYRARDPRIGREVAIKILPPSYAATPDRLRRFEQEARAAGALNHPNLLTVFELGTHEGSPFIVSELIEGSTLREILSNHSLLAAGTDASRKKDTLPVRRAVEIAIQLANGLGAAHDKAIIHRDLKPENVMITNDHRVKLLDFGLAKLLDEAPFNDDNNTLNKPTHPGVVLGTVAYMSPEQVRGEAVDHRSDIFSLGSVLYEMLAGTNPFRRDSGVETMNAILKDDPSSLPAPAIPPALDRIIRHALEKSPRDRFQSARDFAFALESLSGSGEAPALSKAKKTVTKRAETPVFKRLTFRRGFLMSGRFAPDASIIYAAAWDDQAVEIFSTSGTRMSRSVGVPTADILAISSFGELAVSLGRRYVAGWVATGTLARVPLLGGAPREICEDVQDAEWGTDGKSLIILRRYGGAFRIEYPIGNVLYRSVNWISKPRLSPKGNFIAFVDHPHYGDDRGALVIIDLQGHEIVRSSSFPSTAGIAWVPSGDEVWIASEREETGRDIRAVTLDGKERTILAAPGRLSLYDIAKDGTVLMSFDNCRREIIGGTVGQTQDRNLSWFDWSFLTAITPDGSRILFEEQGAFSRASGEYQIYVRPTDGGQSISIGEGYARAISGDGKWVVAKTGLPSLDLLPVGAGEPRRIPLRGLLGYFAWELTPDQKRIIILGNEPDHGNRLYVVEIDGDGTPRALSQEGTSAPFVVSPDGATIAAMSPDQRVTLFPVDEGESRAVESCAAGERPLAWSLDGQALLVAGQGRLAVDVYSVNLATGERSHFHTIRPADPGGIMDIQPIKMTPGGTHYAYGYRRYLSDLFVVHGLR